MNIPILSTTARSEQDVFLTRQRARQIADLLGFDSQDQTRIATAVSEIARNAVQHGGGGRIEFLLTASKPQSLEIRVQDQGPGISDLDALLSPRYAPEGTRGASLRGVRSLMDAFHITTSSQAGTTVTLAKRRSPLQPSIERKQMVHLASELMQRVSEDPLAEMQRQNQELLRTLEELRIQEEERREHLQEIEVLNQRLQRSIRATHHRVKNNLQIISALVDFQMDEDQPTVPISAMQRISQHTRSLAALHDMLTQEAPIDAETETISTRATLEKLLPLLQATAGERCIRYHVEDFTLPVNESTSLALLISELVSNALKHGTGGIGLQLTAQDSAARLEVNNEGDGFPPGFDRRRAANTGLSLIESTGCHDLRGTIAFENCPEGGARVVVVFPIP